jgi:hypothetical protein
MSKILPLPHLPSFPRFSPPLVLVLDKIRYQLDNDEEFAEFDCFACDYPRIYRYHLEHAELRLKQIYQKYQEAHETLTIELERKNSGILDWSVSNLKSYEIYWDFETYLSAINSALDILARVIGTAYPSPVPVSFNKLCAKSELRGVVELHFTPVDHRPYLTFWQSPKGWEIRCKLPTNPNVRDMMGFRYTRRVELLRYSIATYRSMMTLDKNVAEEIRRLYRAGNYPLRTKNLFFLGARKR